MMMRHLSSASGGRGIAASSSAGAACQGRMVHSSGSRRSLVPGGIHAGFLLGASPAPSRNSTKRLARSAAEAVAPELEQELAAVAPKDLSTLFSEAPPRYRYAPELVSALPPAPGLGVTLHRDAAPLVPEEQGEAPAASDEDAAAAAAVVEATVRVWAPHASSIALLLKDQEVEVPMSRSDNDTWVVRVQPGLLHHGSTYALSVTGGDGRQFTRRDPYARATDYTSNWCYVDDPTTYKWQVPEWKLPLFEDYSIYEMHVGSFTPEGTLAAAAARLEHVASLGFTSVQVMPLNEFSDAWGYNPRQLLNLAGRYGTPDDMRAFVDRAHELGLAVIVDVVLHHGAVEGNALWEWDGWSPSFAHGGIYHEGAHDTQWGRAWAFWKKEVREMLYQSCALWLSDAYKCDGLRFDSANDLPHDVIQELTWRLHESFPGRYLTAEVTPENPMALGLGFDSLWVHSGYFDIIHQHRALGRGHHGGGDWAAGWDLPRLRTVMVLHYGFTQPWHCVKYLLGSHDQIGCSKGGAWYEDYKMIGGHHRYPVDQYGGGREDKHATSSARLWWTANVIAACTPMLFMGTEWNQTGWWDIDEWRRPQWQMAEDKAGQAMMTCVKEALGLRRAYGAIRRGAANVLHEDRQNGVVAFERVAEGEARIVCVINASRGSWQDSNYGVWVNGGEFEELFCSQTEELGGWADTVSNKAGPRTAQDGKLWINLPSQCTLVFKQIS